MGRVGIHVFTRDFRIEDNRSLYLLSEKVDEIHLTFCFTKEQVTENNTYKSDRAIAFMFQSLRSLSADYPVSFYIGTQVEALKEMYSTMKFDVVSISEDYTPFATKRQEALKAWCERTKVEFMCTWNHTIHCPRSILTQDKSFYKKFTPFYNKATSQQVVRAPCFKIIQKIKKSKKDSYSIQDIAKKLNVRIDMELGFWMNPSRTVACKLLMNLKNHTSYGTDRDRADKMSTRLSAYLKFGLIGARETVLAAQKHMGVNSTDLIRELYFRDFYMYIAHHQCVFNRNFIQFKKPIPWENNSKHIELWKQGKTGIPIVDAGMRELNTTGFMHNRCRMIVAMFLTKNLKVDWRIGEKYFAQNLIDYDPCSNNGGWQWSASTGTDASPYFRIMNPFVQQAKIDPECVYIRKYLPEFKDVPEKIIHNWDREYSKYSNVYIPPIVDHKSTRAEAIQMFKSIV